MWVTGIIQTLLIYGGFILGWLLNIKLLGATLILVESLNINIHLKKSTQKQIPPNHYILNTLHRQLELGFF